MFTIEKVTPAQFAGLNAELLKTGTGITAGDTPGSWSISNQERGIAGTASYDPAAETLTVAITHKPFFITEGRIQTGIEQALAAIPASALDATGDSLPPAA